MSEESKKSSSLFKKRSQRITMGISVAKETRQTIIDIAKKEGISVSSAIEQIINLAIEKGLIKK